MNDSGLWGAIGVCLAMVLAASVMAWDFKRDNERQAQRVAEAEKRA